MMETSVKAKVLVPQPDMASSPPDADGAAVEAAAPPAASNVFNPMKEFSRRLEAIISTYGSAAGLLDKQSSVEAELEKMKEEEAKDDITVTMETEVSAIMQSLNKLSSPEKKLEDLVRKHAELAVLRRCDEKKLCALQQKLCILLEERQQLQAERCSGVVARSELETLCRELQKYYSELREETLQSCREDEEKRNEITSHFQKTLTEIQAQIEQHSARNDKLCRENTNLTEKLESLMNQCDMREESLEKINKHRELQHKLTETKLLQANALLTEAEDKHKREKEYLLRETIDKTKKCFAMKEQELAMKKKLKLYSQKFDEFQETLAKSNEIYVRFKQEMDNMSDKMKKLEKESNVWKTRFETCNKALTDMIEERAIKNKEYDLFVLKIQKLEKLCNMLQVERRALYDKIKDVRQNNANLQNSLTSSNPDDTPDVESVDKSILTSADLQELQELQEADPVLTKDMAKLKEEQAKLQKFAACLLETPVDNYKKENEDTEEDMLASAFVQFETKPKVEEQAVDVKSDAAESVLPQTGKAEKVQKSDAPPAEEKTSQTTPTDPKPEAVKAESQVEVKPDDEVQQQLSEATPEPEKVEIDPPTDQKPEAAEIPVEALEVKPAVPEKDKLVQQQLSEATPEPEKVEIDPPTHQKPEEAEIPVEAGEVKPAVPEKDRLVQQQPVEPVQEAPTKSEPAPVSENTPQTAAAASKTDSSKKQMPKKKKKRSNKNAS
ncbi:hypothetical protein PAMA_007229 [Pampus argenteus]